MQDSDLNSFVIIFSDKDIGLLLRTLSKKGYSDPTGLARRVGRWLTRGSSEAGSHDDAGGLSGFGGMVAQACSYGEVFPWLPM